MTTLAKKIAIPFKRAYHYLFKYKINCISIYSQCTEKVLFYLTYAFLNRTFVMITYPDGKTEIGQIIKCIKNQKFVLRSFDSKILRIVDLNNIFRIDLA